MEIPPSCCAWCSRQVGYDLGYRFEGRAVLGVEDGECLFIPVDEDGEVMPCIIGEGGREEYVQSVVKDFERSCVFCGKWSRRVGERRS